MKLLKSGYVKLSNTNFQTSGVYAIRNNVNDKVYVGSTKNFLKRRAEHWKQLNSNKHGNVKLTRSVRKHGIENFTFEVLEFVPYERSLIVEREDFWIKKLNSKKHGYNIADASFGDTISEHPNRDEILAKRSATVKTANSKLTKSELTAKYGRFGESNGRYVDGMKGGKLCPSCSSVIIQSSSKTCSSCTDKSGTNNPFFGKKHTEETKLKISSANLGKIPPNRKKIKINNTVYASATEASKHVNCTVMTVFNRAKSDKFEYYNFV